MERDSDIGMLFETLTTVTELVVWSLLSRISLPSLPGVDLRHAIVQHQAAINSSDDALVRVLHAYISGEHK